MKELNAPNCKRETDLIGFLYGELNEDEALAFQNHLNECAACGRELESFRNVRESVMAWRNESLGSVALTEPIKDFVPRAVQVKPSAIAALREFFNLSPLWMKGAVAFASILFCLFAGLAARSYYQRFEFRGVQTVNTNSGYTEQEVNSLVEQRVREELARKKNSELSSRETIAVATDSPNRNSPHRPTGHTKFAANDPGQSARRPLSKAEREQLAADLRLISPKNDSDLDLLDDRINQ